MNAEVQEELVRQAMEQSGDSISLAWQGGEPTLIGLDFYKRAVELEQKYGHGQMVGNGLQTNGTLLTSEWADFLKEYDWLVGISLDGPEFIHNHYRLDKGGHGTHAIVEEHAKMLIDKGVAVNAMSCVTSFSVNYPEELYNYYKNLGLNFMQFIPIVETDENDPSRAADFSVTAEDYGRFLIKIFDLWIKDFQSGVPTTSVRQFESVFYNYVGLTAPECTLMKTCGPYVVVEHNGNVYSCDFFVEPEWRLGNIMDGDRLIDMLNSKTQIRFGLMKAQLPMECRRCTWLSKCYGGCTKDRIKDPHDNKRPRFCKSFKMFFSHAHPILNDFAEQWKKKQDYNRNGSSKFGAGVYDATNEFK
jgi:uncharacterized protein